ncbi:uncharacterized protein LOC113677254 [Pocillopora damicornis]|uniref:uncharacterized protein LOC113677254 n=1 Tax=Pocillopora damicornis TaxID=46731 RepID=UPI000F54E9D5|nr:uncharacterized protein LOC113677254 [Pocillopora damicornis]
MISGCQKCQSNLAGTWFSHCSLLLMEDFAMDEDQKLTMLRDLEIDFLKEHLNGFSVEGNYCFGYFEGNRAEMDDLLVSFQALNSTCYVLTESHSKEKNHNRFSQTAAASFSMQVVWMCLSRRRLRNISPALRVASCQHK